MGQPYIGEIRVFAGNFAPAGWALCQGQLLAISENEALFALIGTTYGGDGQTTFALPQLSSRIPVHQSATYPLGTVAGVEEVTLTTANLPVHSHPVSATTQAASSASPASASWAATSGPSYSTDAAAPTVSMSPAALAAAGGSQPHDNMPPFLAVNFIISLFGVFPSPT